VNSNLLKGLVPVYTLAEKRLICAAQSIALWLYLLLILGDLSVLDLPWNLAIEGIQECVLKTRDIPRLTNPSPPAHQLGLQSPPLRQIFWNQPISRNFERRFLWPCLTVKTQSVVKV
jgi:hypothetical protein